MLFTYLSLLVLESFPHLHIKNHVIYLHIRDKKNHDNDTHIQYTSTEEQNTKSSDGCLLDFVIHLLNELGHPQTNVFEQDVIVSQFKADTYKFLYQSKIVGVLFAFVHKFPINEYYQKTLPYELNEKYPLLVVDSLFRRGPPSLSC